MLPRRPGLDGGLIRPYGRVHHHPSYLVVFIGTQHISTQLAAATTSLIMTTNKLIVQCMCLLGNKKSLLPTPSYLAGAGWGPLNCNLQSETVSGAISYECAYTSYLYNDSGPKKIML